jgi:hypothetical protein
VTPPELVALHRDLADRIEFGERPGLGEVQTSTGRGPIDAVELGRER